MAEWLGVVADDERDLALAAGVVARQVGDVDAGDRGARHGPGRATRPSCRSRSARWSENVWHAGWVEVPVGARFDGDQPRAVAAVVAEAQDVDVVVRASAT